MTSWKNKTSPGVEAAKEAGRLSYEQATAIGELTNTRDTLQKVLTQWAYAPNNELKRGLLTCQFNIGAVASVILTQHQFTEAVCAVLRIIDKDLEGYGIKAGTFKLGPKPKQPGGSSPAPLGA